MVIVNVTVLHVDTVRITSFFVVVEIAKNVVNPVMSASVQFVLHVQRIL